MINDHVSDLLTRIRNAQRAGHRSTDVNTSKVNSNILSVLKAEGMIDSFEDTASEGAQKLTRVTLKYFASGKPVINHVRRVSKPGRRIYSKVEDLPKVFSGLGVAVVSTSKGILSDREARRQKVGGEVLAVIG